MSMTEGRRLPVFLNFSNHPSSLWGQEQKTAAGQFGELEDLPFPQVPADMSSEGVCRLADEYAEQIRSREPDCVLCQGEFCLSWHVIARLKEAGVRVVAACSERVVEEVYGENRTEKRSVFRFVQFREY